MMRELRYRVYQLLEKAEDGDRASWLVDIGLFVLVAVNVLAVSLETVDSLHRAYADIFWWIEVVSVSSSVSSPVIALRILKYADLSSLVTSTWWITAIDTTLSF